MSGNMFDRHTSVKTMMFNTSLPKIFALITTIEEKLHNVFVTTLKKIMINGEGAKKFVSKTSEIESKNFNFFQKSIKYIDFF